MFIFPSYSFHLLVEAENAVCRAISLSISTDVKTAEGKPVMYVEYISVGPLKIALQSSISRIQE